jgi:hypothetical protein
MTSLRRPLIACAFVLAAAPALAQAIVPRAPVPVPIPASVGRIKVAAGAAFVVRAGTSLPATPGLALVETDSLTTGRDGRLGVTLNDDTRLSLGPDSDVRLSRYRYAPADGALALVLNVIRGAAVYVSGQIAKLSPDAVRLETPSAIIGVRGTTIALRVVPE